MERFLPPLTIGFSLGKPVTREEKIMRTITKWIAVPILAVAIVPFLAEWHTPFGSSDAGIAYAKGGGGGGGGGGNGGGSGTGGGGHGGGQGAGGTDGGGRGAGSGHGGGSANSDRGGESAATAGGGGMGHGHEGRGVGSAVSEAATTAAHMSKQDIDDAGFRNRGEAVSTAVHDAQQEARESEEAAEDSETGETDATTP